jgi:hypothetical protein
VDRNSQFSQAWLPRRECLQFLSAAGIGACLPRTSPAEQQHGVREPKRVAAIVTVYTPHSHADVIVGKILAGWRQDDGPGPALQLVSLYVDQFPHNDLSRRLADKYSVELHDTIEGALLRGSGKLAVDGVLSIGEQGDYPENDKLQTLYPRRRFFEQIATTFEQHGSVVPVFNDKHLGPVWQDGLWIYQRAQQLQIPLMAGSSLPVTYRVPNRTVPMKSHFEGIIGIGYGNLDPYGFHALEAMQVVAERRRGAEAGVRWVQCLRGDEFWDRIDSGWLDRELIQAALGVTRLAKDDLRSLTGEDFSLFLFEYEDGLRAGLLHLTEIARNCSVAVKLAGQTKPVAMGFEERTEPRCPHFAFQLRAIEKMIHSGRPTYPVQRTLLTSGILDRALSSRVEGGRRIETPELKIAYDPVDYPHATLQ